MGFNVFLLLLAVLFCGSAGAIIRLISEPPSPAMPDLVPMKPILLAALRLLGATLLLSIPAYLQFRRAQRERKTPLVLRDFRVCLLPALMLALHFIGWNLSLQYTPVVNASLLVNTMPIAMPFLLWVLYREKLNLGEISGTVLTLVGLGIIAASDFDTDIKYFKGDMLALGGMLTLTLYVGLARKSKHLPGLWLYLVPLYAIAGLFCLLTSVTCESWDGVFSPRNLWGTLYLILVPTLIGHSMINHLMKVMRGQIVSLANLGQFVVGGGMAWWLSNQIPADSFYLASPLVVLGAAVAIWFTPRHDTLDKALAKGLPDQA